MVWPALKPKGKDLDKAKPWTRRESQADFRLRWPKTSRAHPPLDITCYVHCAIRLIKRLGSSARVAYLVFRQCNCVVPLVAWLLQTTSLKLVTLPGETWTRQLAMPPRVKRRPASRGPGGRGGGRQALPPGPGDMPPPPERKAAAAQPPAEEPPPKLDLVPVKIEPRDKPQTGEMQRMLSSLKRDKTSSGLEMLKEYQNCKTQPEKRTFYYDRFLTLPKEVAKFQARKTHSSTKETKATSKDFGWVEAEFIALRKGLQDKDDPQVTAKLKYWLSQYPSKPHPGRDDLVHEGACLYHYTEALDQTSTNRTEGVDFAYSGSLDPDTLADTLHAAGAVEDDHTRPALADHPQPGNRQPKPKQPRKEDPEWAVQFKKKALVPLQAARTSAANLSAKVSDAILQFSLSEDPSIAKNELLVLYVAELQKASKVLDKETENVKRWLLKKGTSPAEEQATAWTAEFEHKTKDLKRHKEAFDLVTKHKVAELLQALKST
jgi:hypothetical protein